MYTESVQEFLARGGEVTTLPPSREVKSLSLSRKMGFNESQFNVGRKKVLARQYANRRAS